MKFLLREAPDFVYTKELWNKDGERLLKYNFINCKMFGDTILYNKSSDIV